MEQLLCTKSCANEKLIKRPILTLKEGTGTLFLGGGAGWGEDQKKTLWKGTSFEMDCERWSEFQLAEEHSMSKSGKVVCPSRREGGREEEMRPYHKGLESPGGEAGLNEGSRKT